MRELSFYILRGGLFIQRKDRWSVGPFVTRYGCLRTFVTLGPCASTWLGWRLDLGLRTTSRFRQCQILSRVAHHVTKSFYYTPCIQPNATLPASHTKNVLNAKQQKRVLLASRHLKLCEVQYRVHLLPSKHGLTPWRINPDQISSTPTL